MDKSVIISKYVNNDLDWMYRIEDSFKIYIYDKGNYPTTINKNNVVYKQLKNIGREAHTYLTHIVEHYNELTDHLFFLQGDADKHLGEYISCPDRKVEEVVNNFNEFGNYRGLAGPNFNVRGAHCPPHMQNILTNMYSVQYFLKNILEKGITEIEHIDYEFVACACFYVSKKNILRHSKETYQKMLNYFYTVDAHLLAHTLEYTWHLIFDDIYYNLS